MVDDEESAADHADSSSSDIVVLGGMDAVDVNCLSNHLQAAED